jgi:hypothetical protein
MNTINPIRTIEDVIRGSLLVDKPEQIPLLIKSVTERVIEQKGNFYIRNFWNEPDSLSLGFVGVHIIMRMPVTYSKAYQKCVRDDEEITIYEDKRYILMELQLHFKKMWDGTHDCAPEIAQWMHKTEAEEKISAEMLICAKMVYLTAMTRVIASQVDLKKVEDTLPMLPEMNKADKKKRLAMQTQMLLEDENLKGIWNEKLQVVMPLCWFAVEEQWLRTAKKVNDLLGLLKVEKNPKIEWTNTTTWEHLLNRDASFMSAFFLDLCKKAADSQLGCSVYFGPEDKFLRKKSDSLREKVQVNFEKELGIVITQFLKKIRKSFAEIVESKMISFKNLSELQNLNLSGCNQIIDSDIFFLQYLSELQNLNLSGCNQLTEWCLHIGHHRKLRSLDLSGCAITNRTIREVECLTELRSINLANCHLITDECLSYFKGHIALRTLNISGCKGITESGIASAGLLSSILKKA